MRKTPGRSYYIALCVMGSFLFAAFSGVLYRHYNEAQEVRNWAIHNYEVLRVTRLIYIDMLDMETGVRGYFITGKEEFLEPYQDASEAVLTETEKLRQLMIDDSEKHPQITVLTERLGAMRSLFRNEIELIRQKGRDSITYDMLQSQKAAMDSLRTSLNGFVGVTISDLQTKLAASKAKNAQFIYTLVIGTALVITSMILATIILVSLSARNRKNEEIARSAEERFMTVMNGINDGLFDMNIKDNTVYFSPEYKTMLGYTDTEYPNTLEAYRKSLHPDEAQQVTDHLQRYQNREIPAFNQVFRMRHKDGSWRWILSRGVGIWSPMGDIVRLIGTHTDITEQKMREEELKQLNTELEGFTYITSHDLRSPLVNLKGFAGEMELALKESDEIVKRVEAELPENDRKIFHQAFSKDIPESLQFIKKAVEKMDLLTSAVLDLSRTGKREYQWEELDTGAIVRRCVDTLAYEINRKEIDIVCDPLPILVSDKVAMEQIFGNLIDNAVKYLSPDRKGKIRISAQPAGNDMVFTIKDNGRGIAQNDFGKVFEIFRRARNSGDVRGLGMGMAHVKATLRKLGGAIWMDSTVGEGTTFYFRIPSNIKQARRAA